MFDIITFGSATKDRFLRLNKKDYKVLKKKQDFEDRSICFPLGSKIVVDDSIVTTGGGGSNAACSFARQGFKVAFCGKIGEDRMGDTVIDELKKFKVSTKFLKRDKKYATASSIVLSPPEGERTIFAHFGASNFIGLKDIPFSEIGRTRWFYLAPLNGKSAEIFGRLVSFAEKKGIKIAANLSKAQIRMEKKKLYPILKKIDILILNIEESAMLTGIKNKDEDKIINKLNQLIGKGIVVVTKGKDGSVVSDGEYIYSAKAIPVKIVEKTGAGDAYGAGFLSGLLKKNSVEYAIQLATANACSCITETGAKNGLIPAKRWTKSFPLVRVYKKNLF